MSHQSAGVLFQSKKTISYCRKHPDDLILDLGRLLSYEII